MNRTNPIMAMLIFCAAFAANAHSEDRWIGVEGGTWHPSRQTIATIKTDIQPYVQAKANAEGRELREWNRYTFQYLGLEEDGRRFVLVNALCDTHDRQSLKQLVLVFDGGTCFFNLKYDEEKREFYELYINGEA